MKKKILLILSITVIISIAIIITIFHMNSQWVNISDVTRQANFYDNKIEEIKLLKSVTSPEWAIFSDEDLVSKWKDFFKKLELKRTFRPKELSPSNNGGGMKVIKIKANEKEFSFGIWQTSTELIIEYKEKYYITNLSNCPFEETYDEAVKRHGITSPWD